MDDLLIHYLVRLTKEYPYIRLKTEYSETSLYLGHEVCDDQKQGFSHQDFIPLANYPVEVNFGKLEKTFQASYTRLKFISSKEVLLETKVKLITTSCSRESNRYISFLFSSSLARYLATHQRVVLDVSKLRYYLNETTNPNTFADPTPIGNFQLTTALIVLGNGPNYYALPNGDGLSGEEFATSMFQIECLDPNVFDVFILHEDMKSVTYEILNKIL